MRTYSKSKVTQGQMSGFPSDPFDVFGLGQGSRSVLSPPTQEQNSSKEPTLDEESGTSAASDTNMEDCDTVSTLTVADLTNTSMKRKPDFQDIRSLSNATKRLKISQMQDQVKVFCDSETTAKPQKKKLVSGQVMGLKDISNMNANSHQTKLFRKPVHPVSTCSPMPVAGPLFGRFPTRKPIKSPRLGPARYVNALNLVKLPLRSPRMSKLSKSASQCQGSSVTEDLVTMTTASPTSMRTRCTDTTDSSYVTCTTAMTSAATDLSVEKERKAPFSQDDKQLPSPVTVTYKDDKMEVSLLEDDSFHDDCSDPGVKRSHKVRLNSTLLDKDGAKDIDEIPPFTTLSAVDDVEMSQKDSCSSSGKSEAREDGKDLKAMDVEDMENMQKLMETTPGPKPSKAKVPIAVPRKPKIAPRSSKRKRSMQALQQESVLPKSPSKTSDSPDQPGQQNTVLVVRDVTSSTLPPTASKSRTSKKVSFNVKDSSHSRHVPVSPHPKLIKSVLSPRTTSSLPRVIGTLREQRATSTPVHQSDLQLPSIDLSSVKQEQSFDGLQIQNSVIVNSQEIRPPSCSSGEEAADLEPRPFQRHCSLRTAVRRRNSAPRRMALSAGNTPKIQFKTNPVYMQIPEKESKYEKPTRGRTGASTKVCPGICCIQASPEDIPLGPPTCPITYCSVNELTDFTLIDTDIIEKLECIDPST